tara:strand:- start:2895 stop:3362 length:468 start_codon:yes stop_codon:yes gene_type:complete
MANATIYRVLEALQSKAATDFTSGYSGLDMRNSVIIGALLDPPRIPFASVSFIDYSTEQGLNLTSYRMQGRFEIYCFCGGSNLEDRTKNVLNLTSDIIKEITNDRFLGLANPDTTRTIDNVICNFTSVEGDRFGLDNVAIGYIEVNVTFQSRTGV